MKKFLIIILLFLIVVSSIFANEINIEELKKRLSESDNFIYQYGAYGQLCDMKSEYSQVAGVLFIIMEDDDGLSLGISYCDSMMRNIPINYYGQRKCLKFDNRDDIEHILPMDTIKQ